MNTTEFTSELAKRLQLTKTETARLIDETVNIITEQLVNNNTVSIHNFGTLETKKREEKVNVNPSTGKRMLIPPKLIVGYKVSPTLKDKIKGD